MKQLAIAALILTVAVPAMAKTHKFNYNFSCATLWPAVRDTVRNSGKYGIIGIDSTEMTASYNIGGSLSGKRINSVVLNPKGDGCEMQVQTAFSGLMHNDADDFKKRVDESLIKLKIGKSSSNDTATPASTPSPEQPK